jgi:hypothetical protein
MLIDFAPWKSAFKDLEAAKPGIADILVILGKIKVVGALLAIDA